MFIHEYNKEFAVYSYFIYFNFYCLGRNGRKLLIEFFFSILKRKVSICAYSEKIKKNCSHADKYLYKKNFAESRYNICINNNNINKIVCLAIYHWFEKNKLKTNALLC